MNDTLRVLSAILVLAGILILGYTGITYAITYAQMSTNAAAPVLDDQLPATPEEAALNKGDDPTWPLIGGAASLAVGIGLLFVPRRLETNVAKKTRYHTQYRT